MWKELYPHADSSTLDYAYAYFSNGCIGILENWVCGGYKQTIEEVGNILRKISLNGLNSLADITPDK